jgi:MSHA biogenesis protein MshJ
MSAALRQRWQRLNERYAVLSRRERLLVAAALVFGPLFIGNALFLDPQSAKAAQLQRGLAQRSASLAEMQAQASSLQQQLQSDPDASAKQELAALQAQLAKLDGDLQQVGSTLVRPEQMNGLLERLLARHAGLRLLSLKTLAPRSVLLGKESGDGKGDSQKREPGSKSEAGAKNETRFDLYRHGVEIRLEGGYGELQAYLANLEQLQQRLLWDQLQYKVVDYPKAEMTLQVYTLSPDRAWLAL